MISYSPIRKYDSIWQKYRPVILRLMVDSAKSPQQYKFSDHEFKRLNPAQKTSNSFTLTFSKGKAVNNIRKSDIAGDLLTTLQQSKTALELSENNTFEFVLDNKYMFQVIKHPSQVEATVEESMAEA